jgi:hypothetical protein
MKKTCETLNSERNHHMKLCFIYEFMHSIVNQFSCGNKFTFIYLLNLVKLHAP